MSRPSKRIVPLVGSSSRITRRAVVLLPQPVSPTMPERLAAHHVERHAVDGVHGADLPLEDDPARDREVLDEVAHLDQRLAHAALSFSFTLSRAASGSSPRLSSAQSCLRVAAGRAGRRPDARSDPGTGSSVGSTRRWRSRTYGQRGWNEQPLGSAIRLGGRPGIGTSGSSRGRSSRGIDCSSPQVYGCSGRVEDHVGRTPARSPCRRT